MKVVHVISGLNDGGAEAVLHRICIHDKRNKHTVVSMMDEGKYGPLLRSAGIDVYCLGMPRGRVTASGILALFRLIRRQRPDVVQTWMYHANLVGGVMGRLAGSSSVCWGIHHGDLMPEVSRSSTILASRLCALLSRFVPRSIVCCSRKAAEWHRSAGYCGGKILFIPNGYDLSDFFPDMESKKKVRAELQLEDGIPLLGMVARYDPQKDHDTLLKALGLLKRSGVSFRCVCVGTGMDGRNDRILRVIQEEGLAGIVQLLGRREDVPALMNALDVHILSSVNEAFPNVLAEAMACGTPCVATDVGDAAFIVGNTGWIVPARNPVALAKAVEEALLERKNEVLWAARMASARERIAARFEIGAVLEQYMTCWEEASRKS